MKIPKALVWMKIGCDEQSLLVLKMPNSKYPSSEVERQSQILPEEHQCILHSPIISEPLEKMNQLQEKWPNFFLQYPEFADHLCEKKTLCPAEETSHLLPTAHKQKPKKKPCVVQ